MAETKSRLERISAKIKNNKIVALLIFIGTVVIALSTFTNAARNLMDLLAVDYRPRVSGEWQAVVTYDWPNAVYPETFIFRDDGEAVNGAVSYLGMQRGILEGAISGGTLSFTIKTRELDGEFSYEQIHRYRGNVLADEIHFIMQTEGGSSPHLPVEFIARRPANTSQ